jgi:hypothetical protein
LKRQAAKIKGSFSLKKEVEMKKAALIIMSLSLLLLLGCASRDYVRQQVEPLVERISKLEAKECCDRAESAAKRAENAAKKCEKSFELQQEK